MNNTVVKYLQRKTHQVQQFLSGKILSRNGKIGTWLPFHLFHLCLQMNQNHTKNLYFIYLL